MITGRQGITTVAKNTKAKYRLITTKKQTITNNEKQFVLKYTYSRLFQPLFIKKYSYTI